MRTSARLGLLTSLAVLPCLTAVALAESPPSRCYRRAEFRPHESGYQGGSIPANAPALVFIPSAGWGAHPVQNYEIELRDQDQAVVPMSFEAEGDRYLMRLARSVNGPQLSVRYRDLCGSFPAMYTFPVLVTTPSALPTVIGTAKLREDFARHSGGSARCLPAAVYSVIDVSMSPELQAYRALSRWEITYRGKTTLVGYGDLQSSGNVGYVLLDDVCGADTESVGGPVTIAVHVAGAASDPPPLQLTISARCPDYRSPKAPPACSSVEPGPVEPDPLPDGGAPVVVIDAAVTSDLTNDHAGTVPPVIDAGVVDEVAQTPPRARGTTSGGSGEGCRMAPLSSEGGGAVPGPLWLIGLAVALGFARIARPHGERRRSR